MRNKEDFINNEKRRENKRIIKEAIKYNETEEIGLMLKSEMNIIVSEALRNNDFEKVHVILNNLITDNIRLYSFINKQSKLLMICASGFIFTFIMFVKFMN